MNLFRSVSTVCLLCFVSCASSLLGQLRLPSIIGDGMVLQRDQPVRIWGWDTADTEVTVKLGEQQQSTTAGPDGRWQVEFEPLSASHDGVTMTIDGSSKKELRDILIGEVWVASGQSNMQWRLRDSLDAELNIASAGFPQIRLITVPPVGIQELQDDFEGSWVACSPETAADFSAVAYHYGQMLHQTLDVPVGLIHCSWGGSSAEAWVRRDLLEEDERFAGELDHWRNLEATHDHEKVQAEFRQHLAQWEEEAAKARASGATPPKRPAAPGNPLAGQHRPGNLYAGMLHPIIGYGMRGVIWYQGESNASRAAEYRSLFPLLIQHWRDEWQQKDFPFYWVQLADFRATQPEPSESDWAELREAQTLTLEALPNTGQAVIIDLGEARDIHPRNKRDVAYRLVRWALARDHGLEITHRSPEYRSMDRRDSRLLLKFDHVGAGLRARDTGEVKGFAISGPDGKFVWAEAAITGKDTIEVWNSDITDPVAVRYAWADNPECNVYSLEGLPLTPFRTE